MNPEGRWSETRVSRSVAARRTSAGSSPVSRATCSSSASDIPLFDSVGASSCCSSEARLMMCATSFSLKRRLGRGAGVGSVMRAGASALPERP